VDLIGIKMSEFKDLQPEVCEIIEKEAPAKICPTCKPDPSYIEPTWWLTEEVYLNKKICEYQINMISLKSVAGMVQSEIKYEARKLVKRGIKAILRQLGKLETNEIVCAFPPKRKKQKCRLYIPPNLLIRLELEVADIEINNNIEYNKTDPEGRFNATSLEVAANVADIYYGDNFEVFQILVSIPAENIDSVPESPLTNEEQEEIEEKAENTEEVELDGYDFRGNMRKIKAAFLLYGKYQQVFSYTQNIKLMQKVGSSYRPFYLNKNKDRLIEFKEELKDVIKKNGYRLTSVKSRKTVEKIKIKFDKSEPLKIKSILVRKRGCPYERLRGIQKLKETSKTTVNYIINLEEMTEKLSFEGEDVPWLDFVTEYTYPALEVDFGDIDNNEEPLKSCIDQESVDDFQDRVLKSLLSFSETIQFALSTNECKTLKDIAENNPYEKQRANLKESLEKQKKKRQQRREDRGLSRETTRELKESESLLESAIKDAASITRNELDQIIQELQQSKAQLYSNNKDEIDSIKLLRTQNKINNSIVRKLEGRVKKLREDIEEVKELPLEEQGNQVSNILDEIGFILRRVGNLESVIEETKENIDELQDINKEGRKKKRKDRRKLTVSKLKDIAKEVYEEREEVSLLLELKDLKDGDKSGTKLLQRLNPCKWDKVTMKVVECLLGGMSFAEAVPLIIKAALKNANPHVLENLLIGLPMEERKEVSDKVKKELAKISQDLAENFKEPWVDQKEKDEEEEKADSTAENQEILDQNPAEIKVKKKHGEELERLTELKEKIDNKKKAIERLNREIAELQNQALSQSDIGKQATNEAIEYNETVIKAREEELEKLEEEYVEGIKEIQLGEKSVTSDALANVAGIIFDAYVEAITSSLSVDRLTNLMDKIPGANIFKKLLIEATCPRVDTIRSGVKDLFGSLAIEGCDIESKGYFLPAIPKLPEFRGIGLQIALAKMIEKFKEALINLLSELIIALIIRIIDLAENGLCNSIGVLGALLANALTGQKGKNGFLDAVNDAFCENEDAREDTASDLLGKVGIPDAKRLEIGSALSSAATSNEIKQALVSNCGDQNPKVMKAIWAVIKTSGLKLNGLIQSPSDVRDMFCTMGSYLTDDQRRFVKDSLTTEDRPINKAICLNNQEREQWDRERTDFYENQGLDPNAARDFVKGLNKKMNLDLADMLDSLTKGPEGLLREALTEALKPRDPNCVDATNSIIPYMPDEMKEIMDSIAEGIFGSLAYSFTTDMIGKGDAFFENILADKRGVRLSYGLFSHERRVGYDLLFPNAANTEEEHAQKLSGSGPLQEQVMKWASEGPGDPDPNHLFPETIGMYFHQSLESQIEEDILPTTDKQGRRKKPDLLLKFRNQSIIPDLEFDFGFNIAYNHFKYPDKFIKSDECSIRKFDIIKTPDGTSKTVDLKVNSTHGISRFPETLQKYDLQENELVMPYVAQLFGQVLKDRYAKAKGTGLSESGIEKTYNAINNHIYKKLLKELITDERHETDLPIGYLFGYKDDKITYEDLLYVNPEATEEKETWEYTYEEEDAVLGKSATGNKRIKFLDPIKYGGKFTKPKLYVEQAEHDGWFRIAQTIVPEIDGCAPKRTDFLFLKEITDKVSELQNSIKTDKRLELDPDCVYEPTFDKLLTPSSHAYIEGTILATIRAYSVDLFLRCMPIISHLKLDFKTNYSSLFADFIVDKIEDNMQEQGSWPRRVRDYGYWTFFLEQVVQSSYRMLERGDLRKDPELIDLLKQALEISKAYSRPTNDDKRMLFRVVNYALNGKGKIVGCKIIGPDVPKKRKKRIVKYLNALAYGAFGKGYKKELLKSNNKSIKFKTLRLQVLKDAEREYDIHENIDLAKKIFRFHVMNELDRYGDRFQEAFTPQVYIHNLSKFLLGASKIPIVSDTQAGLSEIESPVGDSALPSYGSIPSVPNNNESPFLDLTDEQIQETKENGGLFLQKYIKVIQKKEAIETGGSIGQRGQGITRKINLEGTVSFDQFRDAINSFSGDKTQYISEVLGNAVAFPELGSYDGTIGVKMGVRVCFALPQGINPFSSSTELLGAAKAIKEDKAYYVNDPNGINYFVPLAHFEQDIIDRTIEGINVQDEDFDEDIKCYFDKMVETDEFKFIFESLLITNKVSAIAAIYSYDGFINSVGLGEDEREPEKHGPNTNSFGFQIGWQGKILDDTKKRLLDLFSSYYLSHEPNKNQKERRERERKQFMKNLLPNSLFNFDRDVRWWQLRRWQTRPFDKDGKDCADTLVDLFRGEE